MEEQDKQELISELLIHCAMLNVGASPEEIYLKLEEMLAE